MNILIRNLYKTPIFKKYLTLSHIVFKQKFFIPQRPVLYLAHISNGLSLREIFAKLHPEKVRANNYQQQLKLCNYNQLVTELKQKQKQQIVDLTLKLQKYHEKYINPIKQSERNLAPYQIYFQQEKQSILRIFEKKSKKIEPKIIQQYFKLLPNDVKQKYEQISHKLNEDKFHKYGHIASRYKIPNIIDIKAKDVYTDMLDKNKVQARNRIAFDKLPITEQESYKQQASRKKEQSIIDLKQFLSRFKVSEKKYSQILQVCLNFSKEFRKIRSQAKFQEGNKDYNFEQDNKLWLQLLVQQHFQLNQRQYMDKMIDNSSKESRKQTTNTKIHKLHKKQDESKHNQKKKQQKSSKIIKNEKKECKEVLLQQKRQETYEQISKMSHPQSYFDKKQRGSGIVIKHKEVQEVFDQNQCLNYDYEELKLLREINKKLKLSNKSQSEAQNRLKK